MSRIFVAAEWQLNSLKIFGGKGATEIVEQLGIQIGEPGPNDYLVAIVRSQRDLRQAEGWMGNRIVYVILCEDPVKPLGMGMDVCFPDFKARFPGSVFDSTVKLLQHLQKVVTRFQPVS